MTDKEIYHTVRQDALSGAGNMVAVSTVFAMLDNLEQRFGDSFTIDGACAALDQLIRIAALAKEELTEPKPAASRSDFNPSG